MTSDAQDIAKAAKLAFEESQLISSSDRINALHEIRKELEANKVAIFEANIQDLGVRSVAVVFRWKLITASRQRKLK